MRKTPVNPTRYTKEVDVEPHSSIFRLLLLVVILVGLIVGWVLGTNGNFFLCFW